MFYFELAGGASGFDRVAVVALINDMVEVSKGLVERGDSWSRAGGGC